MKRLLAAAVVSLISLALWAGQATAGIFNCWCCNKCGTFCVRPYNAFSPVCYGSVTCVGFNPLTTPGCGPNLAFHGSVGNSGCYAVGSYPVMAPPTVPQQAPEQIGAPQGDGDKLPKPLPNNPENKQPENKQPTPPAAMANPYGMTPSGVPVYPTSMGAAAWANPYAYRMPPQMPQAMPYGYGYNPAMMMPRYPMPAPMPQMAPQMPYGYGYNPAMMMPR